MLIKLDGITKYYHSANNVSMALQKINLEMDKGEFIAITGESGSGKSTLISIISGMATYEDGELYIDDVPAESFDDSDWEKFRRNRIGFVFQDYSLIDKYTVLDNVLSAMYIRGFDKETAHKEAVKIIEEVGLKKHIHQKACRLSSGQKQRLSIARALGKDTDIIVADEPTGNLDIETGKSIIELFARLSKDRLVIMVTHNYEQAKDYVTRQIRLYDGEVVSDSIVNEQHTDDIKDRTKISVTDKKKLRNAAFFARLNIVRQPLRSLLFGIFIIVTALVSFVFLGEIYSNYDDAHTRIYDASGFAYKDDTRISVRNKDGSNLTDEDIDKISGVKHAEYVDKYDISNDFCYFIEKDVDYTVSYGVYGPDNYPEEEHGDVTLVKYDKFVKSASCLSQNDLSAGELPQKRDEIVLYSDDESLIGSTIDCYISNGNLWNNNFFGKTYTITGLLKEPSKQVYFSDALCEMLTASVRDGNLNLRGAWCLVYKYYKFNDDFIPVIDDELEDGHIRFSYSYFLFYEPDESLAHMYCDSFSYDSDGYIYTGYLSPTIREGGQKVHADWESEYDLSSDVAALSEKTFYDLYSTGTTQAAVYIDAYANTDKVIESLTQMGYDAVSTFRVGSNLFDDNLVYNRTLLLIISLVVLAVMAVLDVIIVSSLFKIKRKEYSVLRLMGMDSKTVRLINIIELNIYAVIAVIITLIAANIVRLKGVYEIKNIMTYMNAPQYIIYIVYNLILAEITALFFNRYLEKHIKLKHKEK